MNNNKKIKDMKKYIYVRGEKDAGRNVSGMLTKLSVYRVKGSDIHYLGDVSYNSASSCGEENEVLKVLVESGEITKAFYKRNNGCFTREMSEKVMVRRINVPQP